MGFGATMIVGPNGQPISEILKDNEDGIVYADCDLSKEITMKGIHDIAGAYQRFDVFQLHVNKAERKAAYFYNDLHGAHEYIPYTEEVDIEAEE